MMDTTARLPQSSKAERRRHYGKQRSRTFGMEKKKQQSYSGGAQREAGSIAGLVLILVAQLKRYICVHVVALEWGLFDNKDKKTR